MGKNNYLIEIEKRYRKRFDSMIPKIYASMAIALHEEGFGLKRIQRVFNESQALWEHEEKTDGTGDWICAECERLTGIDVRYGLNSKPEDRWGK